MVRLKRAVTVKSYASGVGLATELPSGLVGTIVDLQPGYPTALVERVNEDGSGFVFMVEIDALEPEDAP